MPRSVSKVAALLAGCALALPAQAGFVGIQLDAYYAFDTIDMAYAFASATPRQFTVADVGVDTVVDVEGVTTLTIDFSDNSVRILFNTVLPAPTWNTVPFSGMVFDVMGPQLIDFTTAAIDPTTTMAGFDISRVVLESGRLGFNWNGLSYVDGTVLQVNFADPRQVPEPATLALVGALLGLLALATRRRA